MPHFCIHVSIDGHSECCRIVAIVSNAAVNLRMHTSFRLVFWVSLDKYPEVELLGFSLSLLTAFVLVFLAGISVATLAFFFLFPFP